MTAIAILELAKEVLRLINNMYEDQPVAQRRASGLMWWNIMKPFVTAGMSQEQRALVEAAEKTLNT